MSTEPTARSMMAVEALGLLGAAKIPRETLEEAARRLADCLGLCILTSDWPEVCHMREHVRAMGGEPQATVVGGGRVPAWSAAMVNGVAAHAAGLDDFHAPSGVHPMVTVVPAALGAAQVAGAPGVRLLQAVVVGYDVACRLGRTAVRGTIHRRGLHPTSSIGTVAAAAAAAVALGLRPHQIAHALAVAAGRSAGLFHFSGDAWTKPLQAGWAAAAGTDSALLARRGFVGPLSILEGRNGLLQVLAGEGAYDPSPLFQPAETWAIHEVSYKPYAHSTELHVAADALIDLLVDTGWSAGSIDRIKVTLRPEAYRATAEPMEAKRRPTTTRDAQQSVYFTIAVAAHARLLDAEFDTFYRWFRPDHLESPEVLDLAARVSARASPALSAPEGESSPAVVVVVTRDGRRAERTLRAHRGSPLRPFTWDDLEGRFAHLTGGDRLGLAPVRALMEAASVEPVGRMLESDRSCEEAIRGPRQPD